MCLDSISIKSATGLYLASFEQSSSFLNELIAKENTFFVIDSKVATLYSNLFTKIPTQNCFILDAIEENKNLDTVCQLYEKIMSLKPRKNMTLISIGGGITQDITGFLASTLYRGIKWIFVPTTLLAQVDSCIGAKTSLNFKQYKNLVGTFYAPSKIHIYHEFLKTLEKVDYYSGIGEMAKLHLMHGENATQEFINDLDKLDAIEPTVTLKRIKHCLNIKKSYIEEDEFDTGRRNMLNYGHCFGHAIESSTNFGIPHGQAVVVGMMLANKYAQKAGKLSSEKEKMICEKILFPILKANVPTLDIEKTIQAMMQDKKNTGQGLALVMLTDMWEMQKINDLSFEEARGILHHGIN